MQKRIIQMQNTMIDKFVVKYNDTFIEVHIEVHIDSIGNVFEFQSSNAFVEEMEKYTFHEAIEYNPITKLCIKELKKIKKDKNYNPNHITSRSSYIKSLVESLDAHWY